MTICNSRTVETNG